MKTQLWLLIVLASVTLFIVVKIAMGLNEAKGAVQKIVNPFATFLGNLGL